MKLFPFLVASSFAENKSVKFVTGVTSLSSEFPSDIIDLSRNVFNLKQRICGRFKPAGESLKTSKVRNHTVHMNIIWLTACKMLILELLISSYTKETENTLKID